MKKIIKKISFIVLAIGFLASCGSDDANEVAIIEFTPVPVALSTASNNVTIMEGAISGEMQSIEIIASLQEVSDMDVVITFDQIGGSADESDYSIESIVISAGQVSGITTLDILKTGNIEGDETLVIKANTQENTAALPSFEMDISIEDDYINDHLDLGLDWAGSYVYDIDALGAEVSIDYCTADLDLILFDADFNFIDYVLGSGSCPEPTQSLSGLADGTYHLVVDLFDSPFYALGTNQPFPVTLTYNQEYFPLASGEIIYNGYTTDSPGGLGIMAIVEVMNGYEYTITPY